MDKKINNYRVVQCCGNCLHREASEDMYDLDICTLLTNDEDTQEADVYCVCDHWESYVGGQYLKGLI